MSFSSAKWLYALTLFLAVLIQGVYPHFAEADYLNARFAYDTGAGILRSPAPLLMLGEKLMPGQNSPSPYLASLGLGIALAGLIRLLKRENLPLWSAILLVLADKSELAMLALTLLSLDLWGHPRWQSFVLGLMLLVSPLAVIWLILLVLQEPRLKWGLIILPAGLWWAGAGVYFENFPIQLGAGLPSNMLILLAAWLLMGLWFARGQAPLFIWGCTYTLLAPNMIFPLLMCLVLGAYLDRQVAFRWANFILFLGLLGILYAELPAPHPKKQIETVASVGYLGSYREGFFYRGKVYELRGRDHPTLRGLSLREAILATVPQRLALSHLPPLPLVYHNRGGFWERASDVSPFGEKQALDLALGRDIHLRGLQKSRSSEFIRLALDWELSASPQHPIIINLQALDFEQASFAFAEEAFSPEKWASGQASTYHLIPIPAEIPAGRYHIQLTLGYEGGIIAQQNITQLKVPLHFLPPVLPENPLLNFSDGSESATLWHVELEPSGPLLRVRMLWQAQSDFHSDYTVFVHLTHPDDPTPLSQADITALAGRYPSSLWEKDEWIPVEAELKLEENGDYRLLIGMFNPQKGRLGNVFEMSLKD